MNLIVFLNVTESVLWYLHYNFAEDFSASITMIKSVSFFTNHVVRDTFEV